MLRTFESRENQTETERMMKVFVSQAIAYVSCAYIAWSPYFIGFLFAVVKGSTPPIYVVILSNFLLPLQGFLNYFVCMRPVAVRICELDPNKSFIRALAIATLSCGRAQFYERQQDDGMIGSGNQTSERTMGSSASITSETITELFHASEGSEITRPTRESEATSSTI